MNTKVRFQPLYTDPERWDFPPAKFPTR